MTVDLLWGSLPQEASKVITQHLVVVHLHHRTDPSIRSEDDDGSSRRIDAIDFVRLSRRIKVGSTERSDAFHRFEVGDAFAEDERGPGPTATGEARFEGVVRVDVVAKSREGGEGTMRLTGEDDDVEETAVGENAMETEGFAGRETGELCVGTAVTGLDVGDVA